MVGCRISTDANAAHMLAEAGFYSSTALMHMLAAADGHQYTVSKHVRNGNLLLAVDDIQCNINKFGIMTITTPYTAPFVCAEVERGKAVLHALLSDEPSR